jgi:T5SS/PEP-CTERM-associated repeat protein
MTFRNHIYNCGGISPLTFARKTALVGAVLLASLAPSVLSASTSGGGTEADPYIMGSLTSSLNGAWYALDSDVTISAVYLYVGSDANTYLTVGGGHTLTANYFASVDSSTSAFATVTGSGSKFIATYNLYVGMSHNGDLSILDGGSVTTDKFGIGLNGGSNGSVTVSGSASSLTATTNLSVGDSGNGSLTIKDGALVTSATAYVDGGSDYLYGGTDTVTVTGSGSRWITSVLHFGNSSGGTAKMYISNGALVYTTSLDYNGTIYLAGGSFAFIIGEQYSMTLPSWILYYPTKVYNGIEYVAATVNNITITKYDSSNYVAGDSIYDTYHALGVDLSGYYGALTGGVPNNGDWAKSVYSSSEASGNWYFSSWYGWLYIGNDFNGWIWHTVDGWQYIYGAGEGKMLAWDYATGTWWYERETDYPRAYCYATDKWYSYVSGETPSRIYMDDDSNTISEADLVTAIQAAIK